MATFSIPNSPGVSNVQAFRSVLLRYGAGPAQACRYMVKIHPPKSFPGRSATMAAVIMDLSFLCEQAEMPGKTLVVNDARYYGPNFKYPVQSEYSDITMNFIVRDEMYEKEFFDDWMQNINPIDRYDFAYKDSYATTIEIVQYSAILESDSQPGRGKPRATYMVSLIDAFPIVVAPMGLVWGEEGFHRVSVTFAYTEWRRIGDPTSVGYDLVQVANSKKTGWNSILGQKNVTFGHQ